jgi:hypothetical protein
MKNIDSGIEVKRIPTETILDRIFDLDQEDYLMITDMLMGKPDVDDSFSYEEIGKAIDDLNNDIDYDIILEMVGLL